MNAFVDAWENFLEPVVRPISTPPLCKLIRKKSLVKSDYFIELNVYKSQFKLFFN